MSKSKSKKATSKKSKAKTAKEVLNPISAKQFGRNIVLIVEGEKYSRAFAEKADREEILLAVESFNAKPTKKLQTSILSTMLELEKQKEAKVKEIEKAKETLTKVKKAVKPKTAISKEEEIANAKKILEAANYVVSKPASYTRRGEY